MSLSLPLVLYVIVLTAWYLFYPVSYEKILPGILLYALLYWGLDYYKLLDAFFVMLSTPRSSSKILDMDQLLSLVITILLLGIQWNLWRSVLDAVRWGKKRMTRNGDDDNEQLLPLTMSNPSS
ncbi:hypothetical protein CPB86DRAFT_792200 [Serendipita vermifera]|nr:hypothetical protein CPB86DRAFT_792200 [Serendipita vermifera]